MGGPKSLQNPYKRKMCAPPLLRLLCRKMLKKIGGQGKFLTESFFLSLIIGAEALKLVFAICLWLKCATFFGLSFVQGHCVSFFSLLIDLSLLLMYL